MSLSGSSALAKLSKNSEVSDLVPTAIASVTPSVTLTREYRARGVKAEATTVSHRKPMA